MKVTPKIKPVRPRKNPQPVTVAFRGEVAAALQRLADESHTSVPAVALYVLLEGLKAVTPDPGRVPVSLPADLIARLHVLALATEWNGDATRVIEELIECETTCPFIGEFLISGTTHSPAALLRVEKRLATIGARWEAEDKSKINNPGGGQ